MYKLALVCFSLVFPRTCLPTRSTFSSTLYTHWRGQFGGSMGCPAPCSVVTSGLWSTVVCLCNQTCATALFLSLLFWFFFFTICESESLLTFPMFHDNPITTALFLSLPLLLFLVWAGVPQAFSTLPWVLTLLVEGMVWINVQQLRGTAHTLSSASRASPPPLLLWLKRARVCLLGLLFQQLLLLGVDPQNGAAGGGGGCFPLASGIKGAALLGWAALLCGDFKPCFLSAAEIRMIIVTAKESNQD